MFYDVRVAVVGSEQLILLSRKGFIITNVKIVFPEPSCGEFCAPNKLTLSEQVQQL